MIQQTTPYIFSQQNAPTWTGKKQIPPILKKLTIILETAIKVSCQHAGNG
jgi:hypothetical protein